MNEFVTITWTHDNGNNDVAVTNFNITGVPVSGTGRKFSRIVEAGVFQAVFDLSMLSLDTNYEATIRAYNLLGVSDGMEVFFRELCVNRRQYPQ